MNSNGGMHKFGQKNLPVSRINELELKDGSTKIEYHLVFETDSKEIKKRVETFFESIMDEKEN